MRDSIPFQTKMRTASQRNHVPLQTESRPASSGITGPLRPEYARGPQTRAKDPFCCAYCGSRAYLKAFATVYGNGSMMARSKRGLILKTGWSQTFRQSIVAEKCSPPKPRRVFWRISVVLLGVGTLAASTMYQLRSEISEVASVVFLFGIFMVFDAIRWNKLKFPLRMARWENSYLCSRCSKVTIIEPVSEQ